MPQPSTEQKLIARVKTLLERFKKTERQADSLKIEINRLKKIPPAALLVREPHSRSRSRRTA